MLGDLFTALPPALVDHVRAAVHERSLVSRAVGGTRIETSPLGRDAKLVGRGRAGVRAGARRGVALFRASCFRVPPAAPARRATSVRRD